MRRGVVTFLRGGEARKRAMVTVRRAVESPWQCLTAKGVANVGSSIRPRNGRETLAMTLQGWVMDDCGRARKARPIARAQSSERFASLNVVAGVHRGPSS